MAEIRRRKEEDRNHRAKT